MMWLLACVLVWAADVSLTHQGRLLDGTGTPLEGAHPVVIGLYAQQTGGTALFEFDDSILLEDGYFTVALGPVDASLLTGEVWVDVVADDLSLGARTELGAVPYSAYSELSGSAAALGGVAVDVSDCQDGDVLTFREGTQRIGCEPTEDAGKIIHVTTHVSNSRRSISNAVSIELERFSVDKKSPTSILVVQGTLSAHGNASGSMQQGWRYGSAPEVLAQSLMYDNTAHSRAYSTTAVITGVSQTGPQDLVFRYYSENNSAQRPFNVYNPNASTDSRIAQTQSQYIVWEIEP